MTKFEKSDEVLISLRRIIRAIDLHSKHLVKKYGLTGPQLLLLKEIHRLGQIPVSVLARNINLTHATVTSILDRLEAQGYIDRLRDTEDKRKVFINITPLAQAVIDKMPSLLQEDFITKFQKIEEWEQTQILATLQRIASMMNANHIDASPLLSNTDLHSNTSE